MIQALRGFTRTRKQLVCEIAQHTLRIQKVLEDANIKLGSVLATLLGKSGRAMLTAIVAGKQDPERLAALAVGTARQAPALSS
jgi:transposase